MTLQGPSAGSQEWPSPTMWFASKGFVSLVGRGFHFLEKSWALLLRLFALRFYLGTPVFKVRIGKEEQDFQRGNELRVVKFEMSVGPPRGTTQRIPCQMGLEFRRYLVPQREQGTRRGRGQTCVHTSSHMQTWIHL